MCVVGLYKRYLVLGFIIRFAKPLLERVSANYRFSMVWVCTMPFWGNIDTG